MHTCVQAYFDYVDESLKFVFARSVVTKSMWTANADRSTVETVFIM
jgi:hypothetical protein